MRCPFCGCLEDKVMDSRTSAEGTSIRRRRECLRCAKRYTTFEHVEELPIMVIKKSQAREAFSIRKIKEGVIKACEKRPVSMDQIDHLVEFVSDAVEKLQTREVDSVFIGEKVMEKLQEMDEVAYVRFASVYRQFKDVAQFMNELSGLLKKENSEGS